MFSDDALVAAGEVLFDEGERTVAQIATAMEDATLAIVAREVLGYTDAFAADVFDHANLSVGKLTDIFGHANLSDAKATSIFDDMTRAVADLASMFNDADVTAARGAYVFENTTVAVADLALIFDHANLTAAKVQSIFDNGNLSNARANSIASEFVPGVGYTNYANIDAVLNGTRLLADDTQTILYGIAFGTKIVDILTYGAGDLTVAGDTEIAGVNRYETLTVNGGITLTLANQPSALIVDTLSNSGNIVKKVSGGLSGTRGATGSGRGGQGAGGFVIFADVFGSSGTISADGEAGETATTITVDGDGGNGGSGVFHRVGADAPGRGGDGAYKFTNPENRGDGKVNGGGGGGEPAPHKGGNGGDSTLITPASYAAFAIKIRQYAIDWVIVNVFGKTPIATVSITVYGSGGGGGAAENTIGAEGGGGGGGGEVLALCLTLNNTGTIRADAGYGGNGGTEGARDNEGGGGGGGMVYILYVALIDAGTLQANGGAAGTGDSFDTPAQAGGNGVATSQDVS